MQFGECLPYIDPTKFSFCHWWM